MVASRPDIKASRVAYAFRSRAIIWPIRLGSAAASNNQSNAFAGAAQLGLDAEFSCVEMFSR